MDKIVSNARIYSDIQGLEELRGKIKKDPDAVKKEVSHQFESLMLQMVLKSMRDANKSFSSGLLSGDEMGYYEDMFDKQLSLILSNQGIGFAKTIENNISQKPPVQSDSVDIKSLALTRQPEPKAPPALATIKTPANTKSASAVSDNAAFSSADGFLKSLWHGAKTAAGMLGVHPGVLLAQAALETDWGKKILSNEHGKSTHNLFNIKANNHWEHDVASVTALEQKNGLLVRENAKFRQYDNYHESFIDYANLIKNNPRYQDAVKNSYKPEAYVTELQKAGYASDTNYANKIMKIFNSHRFQTMLSEIKLT